MNADVENLFNLLEKKADMLLNDSLKYHSFSNFILGLEFGILISRGKGYLKFVNWLENKEGRKFAANWHAYILQKCENNENKAISMLLNFFKEYLQELSEKGVIL